MEQADRRLKWHGIVLFLVGLFTGFAETHFANVRMGLAAHLEGVMNGTFLLALGAAWPGIRLSARMQAIAFWTVLYGAYAWELDIHSCWLRGLEPWRCRP